MSPEDFIAKWRSPLEQAATITFTSGERADTGTYADAANAFVEAQGFKPIGFNWELLDPYAAPDEPRSAIGVITSAFSAHMEYPSREWLGEERAGQCARDFVAMFERPKTTLLSNRMGDLWNPLTDERIEWAFVGMEDARIALLLATV